MKNKKANSNNKLSVISVGGYDAKVERIPIPENNNPDIDRLYVVAISGYNCKKEKIYLDDNHNDCKKRSQSKKNKLEHISKR